ncbi:MAG TPA: lysophospholipid acyltransferase family protein [Vicinamibacterales bacterium]|nr:lysophospholipid acyltransferase family protein [Vicinamibacterales bacterium]
MSFHLLRTVFWLIPTIAVYTVVLGIASITSSVFDRRGYFGHACARAWSWLILATTGVDVTVHGLERLETGKTYVFVANHQSIYDIPCLFWHIPFQLRIIAKESLGKFPMLGPHLKRTGHMLVDRSKPDKAGIFGWASRLTANGLSLIVFPEGTRSRDGMMNKFKGGSIMLAMQAGLPLVPISVIGSRHVMKKGELTTRPGHVTLIVHDPIETVANPEPAVHEVRELADRVREVIRPAVEAEAATNPA